MEVGGESKTDEQYRAKQVSVLSGRLRSTNEGGISVLLRQN